MPMLDAHDHAFREQYPAGCRIYDASGRLLRFVVACNPETGEVICWKANRIMATLLRIVKGKDWSYGDCLFRRHGFWPAPLRVVANMPEGE